MREDYDEVNEDKINKVTSSKMSSDEIVIYKLFSSLIEEYDFDEEESKYAVDSICTILSDHFYEIGGLDDLKLAKLAILINKRGIGNFAFTFKSLFKQCLEEQDYEELKRLLLTNVNLFSEIYDNKYLDPEDKALLVSMYDKECFSFVLSIGKIRKGLDGKSEKTCKNNIVFADKNEVFKIINNCYDEVCLTEREVTGKSIGEDILGQADIPDDDLYISDHDGVVFETYCFKLEELLESLIEDPPTNFKTDKPYSDFAKKHLFENYRKEIKMYLKFAENCETGIDY